MVENIPQSETQKVLRAAQIMFEQGNVAAAEAIFRNILSQVGDDTQEGALCLSNLADIHESRGELQAALDWGLRLLRNPHQQQPVEVEAARADQAAVLMTRLGHDIEAEEWKKRAQSLYSEEDRSIRRAPSQPLGPAEHMEINEGNWILRALQDSAYKVLERSRREHFENQASLRASPVELEPQEQAFTAPAQAPLADRGLKTTESYRLHSQSERTGSPHATDSIAPENPEDQILEEDQAPAVRAPASPPQPPHPVRLIDPSQHPAASSVVERRGRGLSAELQQKGWSTASDQHSSIDYNPGAENKRHQDTHNEYKRPHAAPGRSDPGRSNDGARGAAGLRSIDASAPPPQERGTVLNNIMQRLLPTVSTESPLSAPPGEPESERKPANPAVSFMAAVGILVILLFAAWNLIPRRMDVRAEFNKMPHVYKDATGTTILAISDIHFLNLTTGNTTIHNDLQFYTGDWRDLLHLAFSTSTKPAYCLTRDVSGLHDRYGSAFYTTDGPELQLTQRCDLLMSDADAYFEEHTAYPQRLNDFRPIDVNYKNPITGEAQKIELVSLRFGSAKSDEETDDLRAEFYDDISKAKYWNSKQPMKPGGIKCISAAFQSSRGVIKSLVISAAEANGTVISGSAPGLAFHLISEDGKRKAQSNPSFGMGDTAWILLQPLPEQLAFFLNNAAWMLFTGLALGTLGAAMSSPKKAPARSIWLMLSVGFGIASALYLGVTIFRMH